MGGGIVVITLGALITDAGTKSNGIGTESNRGSSKGFRF